MRDYTQAAIQLRDGYGKRQRAKYVAKNEKVSEYGIKLMKLVKIIPNWETYITARQKQAVNAYLINLHASDVAKELKVTESTAYEILFGRKSGESLGALGRLVQAHQLLKETGYYERLEKRQEMKRVK